MLFVEPWSFSRRSTWLGGWLSWTKTKSASDDRASTGQAPNVLQLKRGIKELVSGDLRKLIREVPDFPKPGIRFYDITTLLKDKDGFHGVIDGLKAHYRETQVDVVLGIEARGFIFAPALAYALNAGFVPVRKPKKLPAECVSVTYDLEYGTDTLEMHKDAVQPGQPGLIVADLLATGGTAAAAARRGHE